MAGGTELDGIAQGPDCHGDGRGGRRPAASSPANARCSSPSGNTGIALAMIARRKGYRLTVVIPRTRARSGSQDCHGEVLGHHAARRRERPVVEVAEPSGGCGRPADYPIMGKDIAGSVTFAARTRGLRLSHRQRA